MLSPGQILQTFPFWRAAESGKGEAMKITSVLQRQQPGRKVQGIAAGLLPYRPSGEVAVEAFQKHLLATHRAGLMNAVNMDTGYVNYLSVAEKQEVLRWTREALGKDVPFVAGAYIEGQDGHIAALYRKEMESIVGAGGVPNLFPTTPPPGKPAERKTAHYQEPGRGVLARTPPPFRPIIVPHRQ